MARILVIDDDDMTCEMLGQVLDRAGYGVITASDGATGVNLCTEACCRISRGPDSASAKGYFFT